MKRRFAATAPRLMSRLEPWRWTTQPCRWKQLAAFAADGNPANRPHDVRKKAVTRHTTDGTTKRRVISRRIGLFRTLWPVQLSGHSGTLAQPRVLASRPIVRPVRVIVSPLLVVFALAFLTACGTARHNYTVREVEQAFASQRVSLHKVVPRGPTPGLVTLRHGTKPHIIAIDVWTGQWDQRPLVYIARSRGERHYRVTTHGNLIVGFDPLDASTVSAALARLG